MQQVTVHVVNYEGIHGSLLEQSYTLRYISWSWMGLFPFFGEYSIFYYYVLLLWPISVLLSQAKQYQSCQVLFRLG